MNSNCPKRYSGKRWGKWTNALKPQNCNERNWILFAIHKFLLAKNSGEVLNSARVSTMNLIPCTPMMFGGWRSVLWKSSRYNRSGCFKSKRMNLAAPSTTRFVWRSGYQEKAGVNCGETYAPVVKLSIRTVLAMSIQQFHVHQCCDVDEAAHLGN